MTGPAVTGAPAPAALPALMRAAVWHGPGRPLTLEHLPVPRVERPEDVVIRVRAAMFGAALVRAVTVGHPRMTPPAVLGTLVAGRIAALGPAVRHLTLGQSVTVDPHPPCGRCDTCRHGPAALCTARARVEPGAHAEYVRLRPPLTDHVVPVPTGVSAGAAMLTEIVACVLDATDTAGIGPGQSVLVIGCGPVALIQVRLALLRGAERVLCTVNHPARRAAGRRPGATVVDVDRAADAGRAVEADDRTAQRVRALTDGRGPHVVVEAVGRAETYRQAFALVRPGGTVVGFGGCPPGTTLPVDLNALHYRRIRYIGSYHYGPGVFRAAADLLARGVLDLNPLLTHRIPLDRIGDAVRTARLTECLVPVVEPWKD
ncbi:zinc-binding dehydrogenase [Kitasatospora sp. NPDC002551]|uniref:zinc-dependent alcohol dehydrogenase n=1 Tax=Kitasatospora sp. NPDC002551 TaxID=3154539 RepID=UPI0033341FD4